MHKYYNPSLFWSIFHSIIAGCIGCFIWTNFVGFSGQYVQSFSLSFAIWSKIADSFRVANFEHNSKYANKIVHKDYLLDRIKYLRSILKPNRSKNLLAAAISNIEDILVAMSKCCGTTTEKNSFLSYKGVYGNYKTQIEIENDQTKLNIIYKQLIKYSQTIEDILAKM